MPKAIPAAPRHFLDINDCSAATLRQILDAAHAIKQGKQAAPQCQGKVLALIFEKPSTRTRISFDLAARQLQAECLVLQQAELQLGRGESISDTAKVLSRYVQAIMLRTTSHTRLLELAAAATVPVINGLTDKTHPCQVLADLQTIEEKVGSVQGKTVAWLGDPTNVCTSLVQAAEKLNFTVRIACPEQIVPAEKNAHTYVTSSVAEAVKDADAVFTDTWFSMGVERSAARHQLFKPYQVTPEVMQLAAPHAIFLHCLPANRGEEVLDVVMDGAQSGVWDEAENRLHAQKAIIAWCWEAL